MVHYLKNTELRHIRGILANKIRKQDDAPTVAKNSGLDIGKIGFSDKAEITSDGMLSQAKIEGKMESVLSRASKQEGTSYFFNTKL